MLPLKELCRDNCIDEAINPWLIHQIPQASLSQLIFMRSKDSDFLNDKIQPYLVGELETAPLEKLLILEPFHDEILDSLVELKLQEKIAGADLPELLKVRSKIENIWYLDEEITLSKDLLEQVDKFTLKLIEESSFSELLALRSKYNAKLLESFIEPKLRENIGDIVDRLVRSKTYRSATDNSRLLVEIADSLTNLQWEQVLNAFCENDQIYDSFDCPSIFCKLFNKDVEINGGIVKPYWLFFREKLNRFNSDKFAQLKRLIDSHYISE